DSRAVWIHRCYRAPFSNGRTNVYASNAALRWSSFRRDRRIARRRTARRRLVGTMGTESAASRHRLSGRTDGFAHPRERRVRPFTDKEQNGAYAGGDLLVHYQTPLIAGNDVFMEFKTGQFLNIKHWESQTWGERRYSWV